MAKNPPQRIAMPPSFVVSGLKDRCPDKITPRKPVKSRKAGSRQQRTEERHAPGASLQSAATQDTILPIVPPLRVRLGGVGVVRVIVPIAAPLPDVAVHVVQAERIGLEGSNGNCLPSPMALQAYYRNHKDVLEPHSRIPLWNVTDKPISIDERM